MIKFESYLAINNNNNKNNAAIIENKISSMPILQWLNSSDLKEVT